MSISLRSNADGSGTLLNGSTPVMEITAAGVVSLPNIAAGSSANQPVNLGQFIGTNASFAGNGYQKLPSGLIIQWGSAAFSSGSVSVTFPISFPSGIFITIGNHGSSVVGSSTYAVGVNTQNNAGATFTASNTGTTGRCSWISIGY